MELFRSHSVAAVALGVSALLLFESAIHAQTPAWNLPASGYVFDSGDRSVRPIQGFLGAARLGSAVLSGVDNASLAPNLKSALVSRDNQALWIADLAVPDQSQVVPDVAAPQQTFWSADSNRLVLLSARGQLTWLSRSGSTPHLEASSNLLNAGSRTSLRATRNWSVLAVDRAADKVLLSLHSGANAQLWLASRNARPSLLPFPGQPSAAVFASDSAVAYVADASSHQILQITNLNSVAAYRSLPSLDPYVNDPAGLIMSTDDRVLFLADRKADVIRAFDPSTGALLAELAADSLPDSITPVSSSLFLLNQPGSGHSFFFLDTALPGRVLFVPAGA